MKKTLSLVLAMVMALSVFSGVSFSAFAATVTKVEYNQGKPITVIENVNGWWTDGPNHVRDHYFHYDYYLNMEDTVTVTMSDGTSVVYHVSDDYEDFVSDDGDVLNWTIYDNQRKEHWKLGENEAYFVVFGAYDIPMAEGSFTVTVIKQPVSEVKVSVDKLTIVENTSGWWGEDDNENIYFHYEPVDCFEEGDTITLSMNDGTSEVYTYRLVEFPEEEWSYYTFADDDGNCLDISVNTDQYDNHWSVGVHTAEFVANDFGAVFEVPIEIVQGTPDDCWHAYSEWEYINGYLQQTCIGNCGYVSKLPFVDLRYCEEYGDYIEYTSVSNKYITGTNPPVNNVFSPRNSITRSMMITILYRMADSPYDNGNNPYKASPFTDIKDTKAYYYNAACWALDEGVTTEKTFKPFDNVTREQTAAMLFRYAKANDMIWDEDYTEIELEEYPDSAFVHKWAVEPLQWANYNSMITGTQQGYLNPQGATQRVHAAKILYGFGMSCGIGNFVY